MHKKDGVACRITKDRSGKQTIEVRTFSTMTPDLLPLNDWLAAGGVTPVARESTGVYWQPVYNLLESSFEPMRVNPRHFQNVPGRKTEVKDAQWLAQLL